MTCGLMPLCLCQVSAMTCGLMPLCAEAISIGAVSYSDFEGAVSDKEDRDKLVRALGPNNKVRTATEL